MQPQCSDILSRDQIFELYRIIKAEIMLTVGEVKNVVENVSRNICRFFVSSSLVKKKLAFLSFKDEDYMNNFLCSQDQDKLWLLDCSCESIDISNSTTISGEEIFKAFKYMCKSYTTKVEKVQTIVVFNSGNILLFCLIFTIIK